MQAQDLDSQIAIVQNSDLFRIIKELSDTSWEINRIISNQRQAEIASADKPYEIGQKYNSIGVERYDDPSPLGRLLWGGIYPAETAFVRPDGPYDAENVNDWYERIRIFGNIRAADLEGKFKDAGTHDMREASAAFMDEATTYVERAGTLFGDDEYSKARREAYLTALQKMKGMAGRIVEIVDKGGPEVAQYDITLAAVREEAKMRSYAAFPYDRDSEALEEWNAAVERQEARERKFSGTHSDRTILPTTYSENTSDSRRRKWAKEE